MQKCTKKDLKHISILNIQTISEEIRKNYYFLKKILLLFIKKLLVFVKKNFLLLFQPIVFMSDLPDHILFPVFRESHALHRNRSMSGILSKRPNLCQYEA